MADTSHPDCICPDENSVCEIHPVAGRYIGLFGFAEWIDGMEEAGRTLIDVRDELNRYLAGEPCLFEVDDVLLPDFLGPPNACPSCGAIVICGDPDACPFCAGV